MMSVTLDDFFITSDTWFGRPNILEIANRTSFKNVDEMDATLIKNWNKVVSKKDTVFHLGNFAWDVVTAAKVLDKLNGNIYFILGNSDQALVELFEQHEYDGIYILDGQIFEFSDFDLVMSHYPLEVWAGVNTGTIHAHGHTVYSHKTNLEQSLRVNACTDFWNYTPIKFSTIKSFVDDIKNK